MIAPQYRGPTPQPRRRPPSLRTMSPGATDPPGSKSLERSAGPERVPALLRVLIVEDAVDAAETLGTLLELTGHEVAIAYYCSV